MTAGGNAIEVVAALRVGDRGALAQREGCARQRTVADAVDNARDRGTRRLEQFAAPGFFALVARESQRPLCARRRGEGAPGAPLTIEMGRGRHPEVGVGTG